MIEPYSSLQTVFMGCLAAILVMTVATPFIRLKPKFRSSRWWLTLTHLLAWAVAAITLIVSVITSKPGDTGGARCRVIALVCVWHNITSCSGNRL